MKNKYVTNYAACTSLASRLVQRFFMITALSLAVMIVGSAALYAQDGHTLRGKVTSAADNSAIPGANVVIKGTASGTTTDINGEFSIQVKPTDVLVVSFIGFHNEEIEVGNRTQLEVALVEEITALSEVVVIGYGTQKKSDLTGAVASVKGDDLRGTVTANVDQALQGRIAGVQVTQNTGQPGGATSIRIRGTSSITGSSEPLYVVDGVQIGGQAGGISGFDWQGGSGGQQGAIRSPIANLNPNDIESIDVLKDASATAIYGTRAANGVVIITTKRGKKGRATVSYNGFYAIQDVYKTFDLMDLSQYAEYNNEVAEEVSTINPNPQFADPSILGKGTDWQEAVFQKAPMQSHNVSVKGGSDAVQYMVSLGYFTQEGIIVSKDDGGFDRFTLRTNIDAQPTNKLKIGLSLNASRTDNTIILQDGGDGVISQAAQMPPQVPVRNFDGTFAGPNQTQGGSENVSANPVAMALLRTNDVIESEMLSNLYLDYAIIDGLNFRSELGVNTSNSQVSAFIPQYEFLGAAASVSQLGVQYNQSFYWLWKNYATYTKSFGSHSLTAMAAYESQKSEWEGITAFKIRLPNDLPVMSQGEVSNEVNTGYKGWNSMASVFGRVIYGYKDRYQITATLRRDGSSRFGPEERWGNFPSVAAFWRISDEPFMDWGSNIISDLKLRAGYGEVGNQEIGNYSFGSSLNAINTFFGAGVRNARFPNPNVKWESTSSYNVGLDVELFRGRISGTVEAYIQDTEGLLMQVNLPDYFGTQIAGPTANVGHLRNKGLEISLNTININKGKFTWTSHANATFNRNKIIDIGGAQFFEALYWYSGFQTATVTQAGYPIGQFYGYEMEGIFTSKEEIQNHAVQIPDPENSNTNYIERTSGLWLGDVKWKDQNRDGRITAEDQKVIGDPNPFMNFGFNNSFSYGPFSLDVFIIGALRFDVLNYSRARNEQMTDNFSNQSVTVQNRARTQLIEGGTDPSNIDHVELINPDTNIPRFDNGRENFNHYMSSRWIEDGTYVRLQNVRLAYTLPSTWTEKIRISRMEVYTNIQNLATITNYSGLDPEIGAFNQSGRRQNIDMGRYPAPRVYTVGFNVDF